MSSKICSRKRSRSPVMIFDSYMKSVQSGKTPKTTDVDEEDYSPPTPTTHNGGGGDEEDCPTSPDRDAPEAPDSPTYCPTSSAHEPVKSGYCPVSPTYSPTSPSYCPTGPMSPAYGPDSPIYVPGPTDIVMSKENLLLMKKQQEEGLDFAGPSYGPDSPSFVPADKDTLSHSQKEEDEDGDEDDNMQGDLKDPTPAIGGVKKSHSYYPGTTALREIRKSQKSALPDLDFSLENIKPMFHDIHTNWMDEATTAAFKGIEKRKEETEKKKGKKGKKGKKTTKKGKTSKKKIAVEETEEDELLMTDEKFKGEHADKVMESLSMIIDILDARQKRLLKGKCCDSENAKNGIDSALMFIQGVFEELDFQTTKEPECSEVATQKVRQKLTTLLGDARTAFDLVLEDLAK